MSLTPLRSLSLLHELTLEALELFDITLSLDSYLLRLACRLDARVLLLWSAPLEGGLQLLGSAGLSRASCLLPLNEVRLEELDAFPFKVLPYPECRRSEHSPLHILSLQLGPESSPYGLTLCFAGPPAAYLTGSLRQLGQTLYRMLEHRGLQDRSLHVASRLQTVLAAAHDGILLLNQSGCVLDWNPAAERMLGWPGPALHHQPIALRLFALTEDQRLFSEMLANSEHPLLGQLIECMGQHYNGSLFDLELTLSQVLMSKPPIFTLTIRDISERRRIEQRLRETKARLETLMIHLQAGLLLENAQGEVLLTNPAFCQLFKMLAIPEELVGLPYERISEHFCNSELFLEGVSARLQEGQQVLGEVLELQDGRYFERDFIPIMVENQRIGQIWVYRDVSAAIAAAREREVLSRFPDENPNPVLRVNPQGQVLYANKPAHYLLCYLGCEVNDKSEITERVEQIIGQINGDIAQQLQLCLSTRSALQQEVLFGRRCYQLLWTPCFKGENGNQAETYVNLYATDITERRAAEAEAISARDEALKSSQAKSEFLAMMSHEIRTPLNAVLGMLQMLEQTSLNLEQQRYLSTSRKAGDRLLGLINNLLDFSSLEAGRIELPEEIFDLETLVTDCLSGFNLRARRQDVMLLSRLPKSIPMFKGDPQRISQLLSILVDNALKFTPSGEICVELESAEPLSSEPDSPWELRWRVSDTGIGVPKDKQELIFERFQQADTSNTRRYGGSGLGLSIARELITLFGGRIWLESEPGRGSQFYFSLRLKRSSAAVTTTHALPDNKIYSSSLLLQTQIKKYKILIAEDYEENRYLLRAYLKDRPYELIFACDGYEAVSQWQDCQPDLILMDVQMPGLDGLEATARIRAQAKKRFPIVALTADTQELTHRRCLEAGCDDLLTKPIEQDCLLKTLDDYLAPFRETETSEPMLETERLADLLPPVNILPDVVELLPLFMQLRESEPAAIRQACGLADWEALLRLGHGLKGVGGSFGFPQISEMGLRLEAAAAARNRQELLTLADVLQAELERIRSAASDLGLL